MNKAFYKIRVISSLIFIGCLILFNLSCGLETFYVIESPDNVVHKPDCASIEHSDNYFEFYTKDTTYDNLRFLGNEVYYKIYKSSDRLNSEANELINLSNKEDSSSYAAERMIQSYKFQPLRAAGHEGNSVLFPATGNNQKITIRLNTYNIYPAQICIDDGASIGLPVRNLERRAYFNFKAADADSIPKTEDVDVNTNGTSTDANTWYVSMFAVAVGQDSTYSPLYSNILYLGSVQIPVE